MRIAVYTANFGEREIFAPVVVDKRVDYVYFTDRDISFDVWNVVRVQRKWAENDRLESRYYFDNAVRKAMSDYDITIMHGANAQLLISPIDLIDKFLVNDIAAFMHPHRNCIYEEAKACKSFGKGDPKKIDTQIKKYTEMGFPRNYGLHACGLLIRRNTAEVKHFENLWWHEVLDGSERDQLSFDYIRWVTGTTVDTISGNIFDNSFLRVNLHDRR